jgi:mono/diheme cytochrome c family protein
MRVLLSAVCLVGMAVMAAAQQPSGVDPSWVVPPKAAEQQNPLKDKPEAAQGGKKIFTRSCVTCHGDERNARKNNAPDLGSPAVQSDSDGALFWRISNGNSRKGMPSFSSLPEPQRWQLVLYIRSLQRK